MSVLSIVEWVIWGIVLACELWFAIGIRTVAVRHAPPPLWPTLIMSFSLVFLPLIFLFLPFSKLHILWILLILWKLSFMAGVGYIPIVSQLLIWPAYIYACILIIGTGMSLSSPSKQSPWAARYVNDFRDLDDVPNEFSNIGKAGEQGDVDAQKIGLELSRQLKESIESIPGTLSIIENQQALHLEDIDKKKLIRELTILTYVGQRLAVQLIQKKGGEQDESNRRAICNALDRHASEFLEHSPEFNDLIDQRGEQYFQLLQSHNEKISNGNWEKFFEALRFNFEQFCRGGGENEPVIIGDFFSMMPLMMLANQYWSNGFTKTVEFLKTQEPL